MSKTIAEQSQEAQNQMAEQLPPEINAVFAAEPKNVVALGLDGVKVKLGNQFARVTLPDEMGKPVNLESLWQQQPLVIVFYRGGWCPYCNIALRTYQSELLPRLDQVSARVVAISPQTPDESMSFKEKAELDFTVLSDDGNAVAREMGITFRPSDELVATQKSVGLDVSSTNNGDENLPLATVLIVDTTGTIRFLDIHADFTTRTEVSDILAALETLNND